MPKPPPDDTRPMTDEQIRNLFVQVIKESLRRGIELLAIQKMLVAKGLLTQSEVDAAHAQAVAESEEAAALVLDAWNAKSPGGIQ